VADLAGIPEKVLIRAKTILQNFEKEYKEDLDVKKTKNSGSNIDVSASFLDLVNEIGSLDPNSLSPKQALELMYDFVNRVEKINKRKED
jgi:DNA mismatch repair ATPase MutS